MNFTGVLLIWKTIRKFFYEVLSIVEDVREEFEKKVEKIKEIFLAAFIVWIVLIVILAISAAFGSIHGTLFGAIGSVMLTIVVYLLSSAVKDLIVFGTKMLPRSKDKDRAEEQKEGLKKIELSLTNLMNAINYGAMGIGTVSLWLLVFGFESISFVNAMIIILFIMVLTACGFFAKKEVIWPRKIILGAAAFSMVFWFSTLDTTPSRVLASVFNIVKVETEQNIDKWDGAIAIDNAPLYKHENGSIIRTDTLLKSSQFVRFTKLLGETRRINGELFTKIIIPDQFGSYASGKRFWIQSSFLERGVKFYPNTNQPEYCVNKKGNTWEVYFFADEIMLKDLPVGKRVTVTGYGAYCWNSKKEEYVPIISGRRTEGKLIVTTTPIKFIKGGKLIFFFS